MPLIEKLVWEKQFQIIPETHLDLLDGPVYCILTTVNKFGEPESALVWLFLYKYYYSQAKVQKCTSKQ